MVFEDLKIAWLQGSFNVLPMYMGCSLESGRQADLQICAPHVYGVLPMYMGVIPKWPYLSIPILSAPHVYGGDPPQVMVELLPTWCSPCIWG